MEAIAARCAASVASKARSRKRAAIIGFQTDWEVSGRVDYCRLSRSERRHSRSVRDSKLIEHKRVNRRSLLQAIETAGRAAVTRIHVALEDERIVVCFE